MLVPRRPKMKSPVASLHPAASGPVMVRVMFSARASQKDGSGDNGLVGWKVEMVLCRVEWHSVSKVGQVVLSRMLWISSCQKVCQ